MITPQVKASGECKWCGAANLIFEKEKQDGV